MWFACSNARSIRRRRADAENQDTQSRRKRAIEGGRPILVGGKVARGVGVSGMSAAQDATIAKAGLEALK